MYATSLRFAAALILSTLALTAERRVERNIIYGMYSGTALLLDAYVPDKANGYGIVFISGSGWHAPQEYGAVELKSGPQTKMYAPALLDAGYTVFSLNHRAAPRFRYPAAVEDVQRAVRFIRHNASRFGIHPDWIGASGGSSGGHLVSMLGVLDGRGDPHDPDPVNRESARVQCVVARAAPVDLLKIPGPGAITSFLGMPAPAKDRESSIEYKTYRDASPVYHVSKTTAPFLLIHGDADDTVSIRHSESMEKALRDAGVEVKFLRIPGGTHGPDFGKPPNPPDYMGEMVRWFNQHAPSRAATR